MYSRFLNLMLPKMCVVCGIPGNYLCKSCFIRHIHPYYVQYCHVCRGACRKAMVHTDCKVHTYLDGVFVCYAYNKVIEKLMMQAKYALYFDTLECVVGLMMLKIEQKFLAGKILTFVPVSKEKYRKRGFNHAAIICDRLGRRFELQTMRLLKKTRDTKSQLGTGRSSRLVMNKGAFSLLADIDYVSLPPVIIVDDVMTTGATLEECAKVLKEAGVKEVYGLVLARGV